MLKKLVLAVREKVLRGGGTDQEVDRAVDELKRRSARELAEMVHTEFGVKRDAKTYLRNSKLYRKWQSQNDAGRSQPRRERSGPRAPLGSQQDASGKAEIDAGGLSLSGPGPRRTKRQRDTNERDMDAAADEFLRNHGIDPRDMPAE